MSAVRVGVCLLCGNLSEASGESWANVREILGQSFGVSWEPLGILVNERKSEDLSKQEHCNAKKLQCKEKLQCKKNARPKNQKKSAHHGRSGF